MIDLAQTNAITSNNLTIRDLHHRPHPHVDIITTITTARIIIINNIIDRLKGMTNLKNESIIIIIIPHLIRVLALLGGRHWKDNQEAKEEIKGPHHLHQELIVEITKIKEHLINPLRITSKDRDRIPLLLLLLLLKAPHTVENQRAAIVVNLATTTTTTHLIHRVVMLERIYHRHNR